MCSNRQLYSQLALTGLNAFVYTGLNAQKLSVDGWTVGRKSPGDPIPRAPAVLTRAPAVLINASVYTGLNAQNYKWMGWHLFVDPVPVVQPNPTHEHRSGALCGANKWDPWNLHGNDDDDCGVVHRW